MIYRGFYIYQLSGAYLIKRNNTYICNQLSSIDEAKLNADTMLINILPEHQNLTVEDIFIHAAMETTIVENGHYECSSCGARWSAMLGDNEIPYACPYCVKDVDVIDLSSLNYEYYGEFDHPWMVKFTNGSVKGFSSENEAYSYQVAYRLNYNLDLEDGSNLL